MSKRATPRTRRTDRFESKADTRFDAIVTYERPTKKFSELDMKTINPLTRSQQSVFDHWEEDYNLILNGFPGCGKTFLATYLAMREILSGDSCYKKLLIVRSCEPTKSLGFLKGSLEEKTEIYEVPYKNIFDDLFKKSGQYDLMKAAGIVEFASSSYMRGISLDNTIVLYDEFSTATYHELATVTTRIGRNSKICFMGDKNQSDLVYSRTLESGFDKFVHITNMMPEFRTVNFGIADCVRSEFVKSFLVAEDRYNEILDSRKFDK